MVSLTTPQGNAGTPAADFSLPGVDGRTHTLASARGPAGLLVMFICNHCPYVQAILPRIVRDTRALRELGVGSIAIMSNDVDAWPEDSFAHMTALAQRMDFPFPYVLDASQDVARAYGAVCTPDFFGFDAGNLLRYRGRLDASRKEAAPPDARRELFDALCAIAAGLPVPVPQHPSIGCSLKWRSTAS